jgi:hypothetical protein
MYRLARQELQELFSLSKKINAMRKITITREEILHAIGEYVYRTYQTSDQLRIAIAFELPDNLTAVITERRYPNLKLVKGGAK